jgi:hypothetical protein
MGGAGFDGGRVRYHLRRRRRRDRCRINRERGRRACKFASVLAACSLLSASFSAASIIRRFLTLSWVLD